MEIEPFAFRSEERQKVQELANHYNATHIIWGQDTGVRIEVNFLNLEKPDYDAADVTISETARTQIADPEAYSMFVVEDSPEQLTAFSLFALAQAQYIGKSEPDLEEAAELLLKALESLEGQENEDIFDAQVAALFQLGWLHQTLGNLDQAAHFYSEAIKLFPSYVRAHDNLGLIHLQKQNIEQAMAEFNTAIELNPQYGSLQ
ncbi:MAG: tetratricopeptide repeat protein [Chloroflexota bacterium]